MSDEGMSDADLAEMRRWVTPDGRSPQNADIISLLGRLDALTATLASVTAERDALRDALAGIRSTAINDAEHAGMRLMDGSISDLQRALARGEVKRQLALADICRSALNADGAS